MCRILRHGLNNFSANAQKCIDARYNNRKSGYYIINPSAVTGKSKLARPSKESGSRLKCRVGGLLKTSPSPRIRTRSEIAVCPALKGKTRAEHFAEVGWYHEQILLSSQYRGGSIFIERK